MKSTGVVRKIDPLGRMVLPKELRKTLSIQPSDPMEILVDGEKIVLQKYNPMGKCIVTGEMDSTNVKVGNANITLSREGAEELLKELNKFVK